MLHPTMTRDELETWARDNHVSYALSFPAKMLLVPTSRLHTNWLWVHQQNNTPIWEIITRPSAHTVIDSNENNAPLEFQEAAIHFLHEAATNASQALLDETTLLQQSLPNNPILQGIYEQLLIYRGQLRTQIHPRSKQDRHTQQLWLDTKRYQLQYREESIAWCGGGGWANLSIHLDGRSTPVTCDCKQGKRSRCRFAISAIDQTLELLQNPTQHLIHEQIIKLIDTPKWIQDFELIDESIKDNKAGSTEQLGWRLKETKLGFQIEAVWCIYSNGSWKQKRAALADVLTNAQSTSDEVIAHLLASNNHESFNVILELLEDHPRVFIGSRSTETGAIIHRTLSLQLNNTPLGIDWTFCIDNTPIPTMDLYQQISTHQLNLWYSLENNNCSYSKISFKLQWFIKSMCSFMQIIPKDAYAALFKRIPQIEKLLPITLDHTLRGEEKQPDSRPIIRITSATSEQLRIELFVQPLGTSYHEIGTGKITIYHYSETHSTFQFCNRDLEQENQNALYVRKILGLSQKQNYQWVITEPDHIFTILSTLQNLPPAYSNRIEWLATKPQIKHVSMSDMTIDLFNTETGFLVKGGLLVDDNLISLWEILPSVRSKSPYLLVQGHVWFSITEHFKQQLTHLADTITPIESNMVIQKSHALSLTSILSEHTQGDLTPLQNTTRHVHPLRYSDSNFYYKLRPYQIEAVEWMLQIKQLSSGVILADEMGLGKTIQTLSFIHEIQDDIKNKTLVIAPKSTLHNWLNEAQQCLPDWDIAIYDGHTRQDLLQSIFPKQCLIMTYDIAVKDIEILSTYTWKTLVLDEAQFLKNPESGRHKSIKMLEANFTLALTGTPVENSLLDLWSIMSIVVPNHLGSWKLFRNRFVKPIESGNVDRLRDLQFLLNPFLKRRVKEEVTPDLPAKIEINDIIPLSLFERDTYDQIRQQAQSLLKSAPSQAKFQILPLLTKLRQICCHRGLVISSASDHSSKLDRAMEILEQINQGNRKVLIFSQFVQLLQKMKERIIERDWEYCYLDGSTPTNQRQIEIERFQEGTPKIFLISLKAGGSGINLTQATEVIHLDPWWNPAIEDQASDRAHRIGQTQTVTVIRLLAEDTIETQILRLQQEKRTIANNILGDNLSSLTLDELSEILS